MIDVLDLSKIECIYTLFGVYIHPNLNKSKIFNETGRVSNFMKLTPSDLFSRSHYARKKKISANKVNGLWNTYLALKVFLATNCETELEHILLAISSVY
jgi:hypothetical protein